MADSRYQQDFAWESPYGHAVRLVKRLAAPRGVVLDLGAGFGAIAEPLAEHGFTYVGCDVNPIGLTDLAARGFEAHDVDLGAIDHLAKRLTEIVGERPVSAVLMLDTLEHLADTDGFLDALATVAKDLGDPLLVLSVPNVAHVDLGVKLLLGRWDVTPTGLLDETHLRFFTIDRLRAELSRRGWGEVGTDDFSLRWSDQHFPAEHPAFSDALPVGRMLRTVRMGADPFGEVNQFVRAFLAGANAEERAMRTGDPPVVTAIVLVDGASAEALDATLAALADQHDQGIEVVVAPVADPLPPAVLEASARTHGARLLPRTGHSSALAHAIAEAGGRYFAFVQPGEVVGSDWVDVLREGASSTPGMVLRCAGPAHTVHTAGVPRPRHGVADPREFAVIEAIVRPRGPLSAYAVPAFFPGLAQRLERPSNGLGPWRVVVDTIQLCGVRDTPRATSVNLPDGGPAPGLSADGHARLQAALQEEPLILPPGSADRVTRLIEVITEVEGSVSWRLTRPLRAITRRLRRRRS